MPPRVLPPRCLAEVFDGSIPQGFSGEFFGDGAAWDVHDDRVHCAAFAVGAFPGTDGSEEPSAVTPAWLVRATVGGWFPSSFRAELLAIAAAKQFSGFWSHGTGMGAGVGKPGDPPAPASNLGS